MKREAEEEGGSKEGSEKRGKGWRREWRQGREAKELEEGGEKVGQGGL